MSGLRLACVCVCVCVCVLNHSVVSDSLQPHGLLAHQVPLSIAFSRQEYWSGLLFASSGYIFPTQWSNCHLLNWQMDSLPLSHHGSSVISWLLVKSTATVHIMRTMKYSSLLSQTAPHGYQSFLICPSWNWQSYCLCICWDSMNLLSPSVNGSVKCFSIHFANHLFSSVAQLCPTLCNPMDCSTPGFPIHHQLLELAQPHIHWVGDAIQSSHPLLSPSLPAFDLSSIKVFSNELALRIQHRSFQWIFRGAFL